MNELFDNDYPPWFGGLFLFFFILLLAWIARESRLHYRSQQEMERAYRYREMDTLMSSV